MKQFAHTDITLPDDPELVLRLQQKEKQYMQRLQKPGITDIKKASAYYKWKILSVLLDQRSVNCAEMLRVCSTEAPAALNMERFANAWDIIDSYASGKGESIVGGKGLPTLRPEDFQSLSGDFGPASTQEVDIEQFDSSEINWDALGLPPE